MVSWIFGGGTIKTPPPDSIKWEGWWCMQTRHWSWNIIKGDSK